MKITIAWFAIFVEAQVWRRSGEGGEDALRMWYG
jgi:hypothetical protein